MKKILIIFGGITIAFFSLLVCLFLLNRCVCEGEFKITNKYIEDEKYFFQVDRGSITVTIECEKDIYENLICREEVLYHLKFQYHSFFPDRGFLLYLDSSETLALSKNKP